MSREHAQVGVQADDDVLEREADQPALLPHAVARPRDDRGRDCADPETSDADLAAQHPPVAEIVCLNQIRKYGRQGKLFAVTRGIS